MKTATTRTLQRRTAACLDAAQHGPVVITRRGQPAAVIMGVEGLDREQIALGLDDDLWEEIEQARVSGYISSTQMEQELGIER